MDGGVEAEGASQEVQETDAVGQGDLDEEHVPTEGVTFSSGAF